MVFNVTFSNISVISWQLVLLVEVTGGPRPGESHWQTLSHNGVRLALVEIQTHNIGTDCIGTCSCKTTRPWRPLIFRRYTYIPHLASIWHRSQVIIGKRIQDGQTGDTHCYSPLSMKRRGQKRSSKRNSYSKSRNVQG